ncbi:MAG: helix-turn-helix domain-containing protein [bacterium]
MNPKTIRNYHNLTQGQFASALGVTLRHYQRIEANQLELSPIIEMQLDYIQSSQMRFYKFQRNPNRDLEGDPSAECRFCFGFIGVGDTCIVVDKEQELEPYCSILCAIRQELFKKTPPNLATQKNP